MSSEHRSEIRMTAAEYLEWERQQDERHEFLMAGGTRRHSLVGTNLGRALGNWLAESPCEVHRSDMRILIPATGLYAKVTLE